LAFSKLAVVNCLVEAARASAWKVAQPARADSRQLSLPPRWVRTPPASCAAKRDSIRIGKGVRSNGVEKRKFASCRGRKFCCATIPDEGGGVYRLYGTG
jgi:hypothetical protein